MTNLDYVLLINWGILFSIVFLILFIFLRRAALYHHNKKYNAKLEFYNLHIHTFLNSAAKRLTLLSDVFKPASRLDRLALEEAIFDHIENKNIGHSDLLSKIYDESGLMEWRVRHLSSDWVWKRRRATDALGRSLSHKAVSPLLLSIRDKDEFVRLTSAKGLGKLNVKAAIEFIISLFKDLSDEKCLRIADILIHFREDAVPALTKSLKKNIQCSDRKTCFWCIKVLSEMDTPDDPFRYEYLEDTIVDILKLYDEEIRELALIALAKFSVKSNMEHFKKFSDHDNPALRFSVAKALGIVRDERSIAVLMNMLSDPVWDVNYMAAESLLAYEDKFQDIKMELERRFHSSDVVGYRRAAELAEKIEWRLNGYL